MAKTGRCGGSDGEKWWLSWESGGSKGEMLGLIGEMWRLGGGNLVVF